MNKLTAWGIAAFAVSVLVLLSVLLVQSNSGIVRSAAPPPTAATSAPPAVKADAFLARAATLDSPHVCTAKRGEVVEVIRAERTAAGALYLLVSTRPDCSGWIPAHLVANYP